jgi:hypothetical protein
MSFPVKWPAEREEYLAALAEVNPLATSKRITDLMSERFGVQIRQTTVNEKLAKIRGPRRIIPTDKQKQDLFEFVAKHSDLKFSAIAKLYSEKSGIEMDACMCRRWYWSVMGKTA